MATFVPQISDTIPDPVLYTPDFSFLDKMLNRRKNMYEQGFSQVNAIYNNINKEVTSSSNAQIRDNFLKQATENLKNLSAMDLSQQQNVDAATNVFSPFAKNENVLGDMSLTKFWNDQITIGESFKLKDGGKGFSQDNVNYIKLQKMQFAEDSPNNWKSYYINKRSYTPYHDWNKEVQEKMKDFKPSSTKIDHSNGMYIVTVNDKSWTNQEIYKYLDGTLSNEAKQQMQIEAAVRLGTNPTALKNIYIEDAKVNLPIINSQIEKINAAINKEKDPKAKKQLNESKEYYLDKEREINNNIKNINDPVFLKTNGDMLAYNAYYSQTINKLANTFSHKDIEQVIKGDDVKMMYFKEGQQWKRTMYSEDRADRREAAKLGVEEALLPTSKEGTNVTTDRSSLANATNESGKKLSALTNQLKDVIFSGDKKGQYNSAKDITEDVVKNYIIAHPNDDLVLQIVQSGEEHGKNKQMQEDWNSQAEAEAMRVMGIKAYNEWKDIKGKAIQMSNVPNPFLSKQSGDYDGLHRPAPSKLFFNKRGQELQQMHDNAIKVFNSKVNTIGTRFSKGFQLGKNDKRYKIYDGRIESIAGEKVENIQFFPTPTTFDISFQLADSKSDRDNKLKQLKIKYAGKDVTYNDKTDLFTVNFGNDIAPDLNLYRDIPPMHGEMLESLSNFSGYNATGAVRHTALMHLVGPDNKTNFVTISRVFGDGKKTSDRYEVDINNIRINSLGASTQFDAYNNARILISKPADLKYALDFNK